MYVKSVIHQIRFSVNSVIQIIDRLSNDDLNFRPMVNKKSIGELVQHICELIEADLLISSGATKVDMERYYESVKCTSIDEMKTILLKGMDHLERTYKLLNEEELMQKVSAYWGIEYTRFEWLLEILVHFTHHRAQLHTLVVLKDGDVEVTLFE